MDHDVIQKDKDKVVVSDVKSVETDSLYKVRVQQDAIKMRSFKSVLK